MDALGRRAADGLITIAYRAPEATIRWSMRAGNEGDYAVGGEAVKESYPLPDAAPAQIIDGGANIGMFALRAGTAFPCAQLICFEPEPGNFELLRRNLALNGIQAELQPYGLWSSDTTLYFRAAGSHTGTVESEPPGLPVECRFPPIGENCWLKLDVEGAEYEVVPALLAAGRYPRWLTMEVHHFAERGSALTALLEQHGFRTADNPGADLDCVVMHFERSDAPGPLAPPAGRE